MQYCLITPVTLSDLEVASVYLLWAVTVAMPPGSPVCCGLSSSSFLALGLPGEGFQQEGEGSEVGSGVTRCDLVDGRSLSTLVFQSPETADDMQFIDDGAADRGE